MRVKRIEIKWHPGLSIYASEPFLEAVGDAYGWIGGFDDSDTLRCILPYTVIRKAIFRMVRFRVETIPLGEGLEIVEEKSFLTSAIKYFRSIGADMIIPATTNTIFRTYPDGAVAAPYGTYIIDLCQPEDVLFSKLNSSHRRKVRLAMKDGIQIRSGLEHLSTAYELVRDTFKRSNMGFMRFEEFKRYVHSLKENVRVFVADYQGAVQGCTVVPFSEHSAYYVYGGSIPAPHTGATNLLHWEAIRQFHEIGVKRYDFVGVRIDPEKGTRKEGLMQYKQRFGGQLVRGYMWKYSLRPLKYAAYSYAARYLRGGDIVDQERHKLEVESHNIPKHILGGNVR
jgi:lipid II:glycine glycyltransferase (peptidoglycan interpeptide bridge formation enzyme)